MLVEVRIPLREHGGSAYEKVKRRTGDWATAAAGAALWLDGADVAAAGIALSAVNPHERPLDPGRGGARRPRRRRRRRSPRRPRSRPRTATPIGDLRGPADYKRHLARELTHRALRRAAERALAS